MSAILPGPSTELVLRRSPDLVPGPRRRRGRAARLAAVVDVPWTVLDPRDDRRAALTRLHRAVVQGTGPVDVVQLTAPRAVDVGVDLAAAGRLVGDTVVHRDLTPRDAGAPGAPTGPLPTLVSVRRARLDGPALAALRGARRVVLVVETRGTRRAALVDALDLLDGLEVPVAGLVVYRGRLPRTS